MLDVDYEYVDYSSAKYKRPAKWIYGSYEDDWEKDKIKTLSRSVDYDPINRRSGLFIVLPIIFGPEWRSG